MGIFSQSKFWGQYWHAYALQHTTGSQLSNEHENPKEYQVPWKGYVLSPKRPTYYAYGVSIFHYKTTSLCNYSVNYIKGSKFDRNMNTLLKSDIDHSK